MRNAGHCGGRCARLPQRACSSTHGKKVCQRKAGNELAELRYRGAALRHEFRLSAFQILISSRTYRFCLEGQIQQNRADHTPPPASPIWYDYAPSRLGCCNSEPTEEHAGYVLSYPQNRWCQISKVRILAQYSEGRPRRRLRWCRNQGEVSAAGYMAQSPL